MIGRRFPPVAGGGFAGARVGFVGRITADAVSVGVGVLAGDGAGGGGALLVDAVAVVVGAVAGRTAVLPWPRDWRVTNSTAQITMATAASVIAIIASTAGVVWYHTRGSGAYASRRLPSYPTS